MNARIRQLSALAVATALAVPALALAQDTTTEQLDEVMQETTPPVSDVDERIDPVDPEIDAMTPPPQTDDTTGEGMGITNEPDPLQDADPMPDERNRPLTDSDIWAGLDADGDGRVSMDEGRVDADFNANFEMMDGDGDGFVTESEFDADAGMDEPEESNDW